MLRLITHYYSNSVICSLTTRTSMIHQSVHPLQPDTSRGGQECQTHHLKLLLLVVAAETEAKAAALLELLLELQFIVKVCSAH